MKSAGKQESNPPRRSPPATTPEARENQLIDLAYNLVEKRLREGTASSQETSHFLKIGSTEKRLEKKLLEKQVELAAAKTESIQSGKRVEELYKEALNAMKRYSGNMRGEEDA